MTPNRKAVEAQILSDLALVSPGCADVAMYEAYFAQMSDKDFDAFMHRLKEDKEWLTLTVPNNGKNNLSIERNYKLADKWGISFHQRVWMPADDDVPSYLTPHPYLVIKLPVRVAAQRLAKKQSIPKHQRVINTMTGQPTGDSKGAGFSAPELRLCVAMGLEKSATELMKYRGGDLRGYAALNASLSRHGAANQKTLEHFSSGVVSTTTVKSYFTSAQLGSTL